MFIKCFVNPFFDISLAFSDSSLNSFLFEITVFSFSSKTVFFTKWAISFLLAKFARFSLAVKFSDVNLLNSWVVIYLSWSWSVAILFSIWLIFVLWYSKSFLTKFLTLSILFPTAEKAVVVAKLVILGISPLTSFILVLRVSLVAKLVISGISSSIFLILALYTSFLTTSFFTTSLSLLE